MSPSEDDATELYPRTRLGADLHELYAENIIAKVHRTARKAEKADDGSCNLKGFPEYVTSDASGGGDYTKREPKFWTCGFFPGTLYNIMERLHRYPKSIKISSNNSGDGKQMANLRSEIVSLCKTWAAPLHDMASRTDTHDVGFIIMPALRLDWELTGNTKSLESIQRAANSLASRFIPAARAIRSWDARIQKNVQITDMDDNLIVIIDSMCNLDLLFYASKHCADQRLHDIAVAHATTLLRTHLRPEPTRATSPLAYKGQWYSSHHVANLDPKDGSIKRAFTAQGYSDTSTWARGQAWGILGYAQTYMWTKDVKFLQASAGMAEYFLYRLESCSPMVDAETGQETTVDGAPAKHHGGRYVPLWDFDAPDRESRSCPRDSSAGAIAANGMLILSQALLALGHDKLAMRFRISAVDIVRDLLNFALASEKATLASTADGVFESRDAVPGEHYEAILKHGTANNNQHAMKRYADHGLVYGDYYLVEFGNQLLRMGLE